MEKSEQINELAGALSLAQLELENASKDSNNPYFKSKYADLAEVINTIKPAFGKYGLSYSQHPSYSNGDVELVTMLMHKSGQWISSCISAPVVKKDPQGVGSAITYCRRYALAAIAGIAQEDDDGNEASNNKGIHQKRQYNNQPEVDKLGFESLGEKHNGKDMRSEKEKLDKVLDGDDIPDFNNVVSNIAKEKSISNAGGKPKIALPPVTDNPDYIPDIFCDSFPELAEFNGLKICELTKEQTDRAFKGLAALNDKVKTKEAKSWIKSLMEEISKQSFLAES